eukprot:jgi/Undpi1/12948/HiC_scaffold_7.g02614.m1
MGVRLKAISAGTMGGARIGGAAGGFEGFTHTWKGLDCLKVEDELDQDFADPSFILRNINLALSTCGETPKVSDAYLRRKEVQRLICSQCLFVAGFIPLFLDKMTEQDRNIPNGALGSPLVGIIGAGGQLGSAITQTLLDFGWKPSRLAVAGRGREKLRKFEDLGVVVFDDVKQLAASVRLVILAVGPQHARQLGSDLGESGMGSRLVLTTLAGISATSLRRVLGAKYLLQTRVDVACLRVTEETWKAVHTRAGRHLFPVAGLEDLVFGTIQAFCEGETRRCLQREAKQRDFRPNRGLWRSGEGQTQKRVSTLKTREGGVEIARKRQIREDQQASTLTQKQEEIVLARN